MTHFYADHFGASGWLQGPIDASVFISAEDWSAPQRVWRTENLDYQNIAAMFVNYGERFGSSLFEARVMVLFWSQQRERR